MIMNKRLLSTLILFTIGLFIIGVSTAFLNIYRTNSSRKYIAQPNQRILLLGDSHPTCSILEDPTMVHAAKSGEAWFYQVMKGKWILENNPSIHTVLIELNLGQLSPIMENWIWDNEHVERAMKSYYSILPGHYLIDLFKKDPLLFVQSNLIAQRRLLSEKPSASNHEYFKMKEWGGFEGNEQNCLDSLRAVKRTGGELMIQPNQDNVSALKEFVQWCQTKNIAIIFIRCPMHPSADYRSDRSISEWRNQNFPGIPFLDFQHHIKGDEMFLDREHLNVKGAKIFTPQFLEAIGQSIRPIQTTH